MLSEVKALTMLAQMIATNNTNEDFIFDSKVYSVHSEKKTLSVSK